MTTPTCTVPLDYLPGLYDPWFLERIRQQLLRAGGRQPGPAVRSEREAGACSRQPRNSARAGRVGRFWPRLAVVVQDGREVFPLRRPHGKNRRALRNGRIVSARAGGSHQCARRAAASRPSTSKWAACRWRSQRLRRDRRPHLARHSVLPLLSEKRRAHRHEGDQQSVLVERRRQVLQLCAGREARRRGAADRAAAAQEASRPAPPTAVHAQPGVSARLGRHLSTTSASPHFSSRTMAAAGRTCTR